MNILENRIKKNKRAGGEYEYEWVEILTQAVLFNVKIYFILTRMSSGPNCAQELSCHCNSAALAANIISVRSQLGKLLLVYAINFQHSLRRSP